MPYRAGGRAEPGPHPACHQADGLQRDVFADLHDRLLVVDLPLGESAEHAHRGHVKTVGGMHPEGTVELVADQDPRAVVAQVLHAHRAPAALAAGGYERGDDVVANLEPFHAGTQLPHDAGAFVPARHRQVGDVHVALRDVVVAMA
jgi:hypothetical protein